MAFCRGPLGTNDHRSHYRRIKQISLLNVDIDPHVSLHEAKIIQQLRDVNMVDVTVAFHLQSPCKMLGQLVLIDSPPGRLFINEARKLSMTYTILSRDWRIYCNNNKSHNHYLFLFWGVTQKKTKFRWERQGKNQSDKTIEQLKKKRITQLKDTIRATEDVSFRFLKARGKWE